VSERVQVVRLDEIDGFADSGRPRWHMIRTTLGIESFGINAWRATAPGQKLIDEHDELGETAGGHEELYLVVRGSALFTVDGHEVEAPAGTIVYVRDPAVRRGAIAETEETTVLVVGGKPGAPFSVSAWERSAEALRFWPTGEWERAIEVLEQQLADEPENAGVLYNLACAESRAGKAGAALDHLQRAIALRPAFVDNAQSDPDFDDVRGASGFPTAEAAG
jgi:tetratricopeptide (TPR) repeat protein